MLETHDPQSLQKQFSQGHIFAYPTEAVFGLGCDPDNEVAVMSLLALKKRPLSKGLILVAANYGQILPYVDDRAITEKIRIDIFSSWPGPHTWLLPASNLAPHWLTGGSDLIAVRVSNHPVVKALCELFQKPLVSTSANLSGMPAAKTTQEVLAQFGNQVILISGELGESLLPSMIRHGISGKVIRDN